MYAEVGIICDEFMAAIEKITSSKRSKWITNPAGQKAGPYSHFCGHRILNFVVEAYDRPHEMPETGNPIISRRPHAALGPGFMFNQLQCRDMVSQFRLPTS